MDCFKVNKFFFFFQSITNTVIIHSATWTLDNLNLPLTQSNFHFPSGHFLYNCTLKTWQVKIYSTEVQNFEFILKHSIILPFSVFQKNNVSDQLRVIQISVQIKISCFTAGLKCPQWIFCVPWSALSKVQCSIVKIKFYKITCRWLTICKYFCPNLYRLKYGSCRYDDCSENGQEEMDSEKNHGRRRFIIFLHEHVAFSSM